MFKRGLIELIIGISLLTLTLKMINLKYYSAFVLLIVILMEYNTKRKHGHSKEYIEQNIQKDRYMLGITYFILTSLTVSSSFKIENYLKYREFSLQILVTSIYLIGGLSSILTVYVKKKKSVRIKKF